MQSSTLNIITNSSKRILISKFQRISVNGLRRVFAHYSVDKICLLYVKIFYYYSYLQIIILELFITCIPQQPNGESRYLAHVISTLHSL